MTTLHIRMKIEERLEMLLEEESKLSKA